MGYGAGRFPVEKASKLGHLQLIENEHVSRLLRQFQSTEVAAGTPVGALTGTVDLGQPSPISTVVTVDGGEAVIEHGIVPLKKMGYIKVCAMPLTESQLRTIRENPVMDPRDRARLFEGTVEFNAGALPLAGVTIPGQTVRETIRTAVDAMLEYTKLYEILNILVSRLWDPAYDMNPATNPEAPHFGCVACGTEVYIPWNQVNFSCPSCGAALSLGDYLGIAQEDGAEFAREEAVMSLRNVLETLTVFRWIWACWQKYHLLEQALFLKDGPLLLRAQLSRLIAPIRAMIAAIRTEGHPLYLVGIEKNGDLASHVAEIQTHLPNAGDYFLPSIPYLLERVAGVRYNPATYRDRVQYGAKVVVRLGPHHVVPFHFATAEPLLNPTAADLPGFEETMQFLSGLLSYAHDNALLPIKLANDFSSISERPSGDILKAFAERHLGSR